MAEFIKLTHIDTSELWIRASAIDSIWVATGGATIVNLARDTDFHVRESPAEVLALLAGEREGKEEGIQDVVEKLRVDIAAWNRHVGRRDWCVLEGRITVTDLERLVAYFDGRKTDA